MNYTYPVVSTYPRQSQVDVEALMAYLRACADCAQSCAKCVEACLSEQDAKGLSHCIHLNFDCADICLATGRLLSGLTGVNMALWRSQLQACLVACHLCGEECSRQATDHEYCRTCAQACRRCEQAGQTLLAALAQM